MSNTLLQKFDKLTIWQSGDERAPHKPLLALWAIGQCLRGESRLVEYDVIHTALLTLLRNFGPPRKKHKPQEPFWRMQKDQVWEVPNAHLVPEKYGSVSPSTLRQHKTLGGFPVALYDTFRRDPALALTVAQKLVDAHFPHTLRSAVLEATLGDYRLNEQTPISSQIGAAHSPLLASALSRRHRNPKFRKSILGKYDHKCAVCGYSFQFPAGYWPALEAAHIKWHSHRGPDTSENGLSLCVLHHELFDWGLFTIQPDSLEISVASAILQQHPDSTVASHHGIQLQVIPRRSTDRPATEYLHWHTENVFRH